MKQKEFVYIYIAEAFLASKRTRFTQKEIADNLEISLSTVNNSLGPLFRMHALRKFPKGFELIDIEKLLVNFGTVRNLGKDLVYSTYVPKPVDRIEAEMPSKTMFTAYSGYRMLTNDAPADYSEVYVYAGNDELNGIQKRFPQKKGNSNLFVLRKEKLMDRLKTIPFSLVFADLWNVPEWYAREFLSAARKRTGGD